MDGEHSGPLEAFYGLGEGKGWRKGTGRGRRKNLWEREESLFLSKGGGYAPTTGFSCGFALTKS